MKSILMLIVSVASVAAFAAGPDRGEHGGGREAGPGNEPRMHGVPQYGQMHSVTPPGKARVRQQVYLDRRSHSEVRHDPHVVVFNHVGYKPIHQWPHWQRDWGVYWRVSDWADVRTVTCEAVNTQTEQLYPVTETRAANWAWTSSIVNEVASRALDECAQEAGGMLESCALVERECWNSIY